MPATQKTIKEHEGLKYVREIHACLSGMNPIEVDVYCVLEAFEVRCPAVAHAVKKLLCAGLRGKGDIIADLQGAIASTYRAIEIQKSREEDEPSLQEEVTSYQFPEGTSFDSFVEGTGTSEPITQSKESKENLMQRMTEYSEALQKHLDELRQSGLLNYKDFKIPKEPWEKVNAGAIPNTPHVTENTPILSETPWFVAPIFYPKEKESNVLQCMGYAASYKVPNSGGQVLQMRSYFPSDKDDLDTCQHRAIMFARHAIRHHATPDDFGAILQSRDFPRTANGAPVDTRTFANINVKEFLKP